ncbi:MAG: hypothetical protein WDM90_08480 [Ferruginibacter sp.]
MPELLCNNIIHRITFRKAIKVEHFEKRKNKEEPTHKNPQAFPKIETRTGTSYNG